MTINEILKVEKEYWENAVKDGYLGDEYAGKEILSSHWCYSPEKEMENNLWIDISEIEIPLDCINPEEAEEVIVKDNYAYIYIGYGLMIEFKGGKNE